MRAVYCRGMPVDVSAEVIANTRLSADYNVLALSAPAIARDAQPGQFVMVKAGSGHDPLLRRPFSVFEVLRDAKGADRHFAPEQTHRQIDRPASTRPNPARASRASARSDARSRWSIRRLRRGWWPAASASRRSRRSPNTCATRVATTLFYGARSAGELFYLDLFNSSASRSSSRRKTAAAANTGASSRRSIAG